MRFLTMFLLFACGLACADTLLVKSVDAGRTWTNIDPSSADRFLWWLQVDSHSATLYALTQHDLEDEWRLSVSTDGGQTWQIRQSFPREIYRISAVVAPGEADTLYLAYRLPDGYPRKNVMITKVTDRGQSMEQYQAEGLAIDPPREGLGSTYATLVDFAVTSSGPSTLYALVTNEYADDIFAFLQALWVSADGGRKWERLELPMADGCGYPEMQIDPFDSSVYLACGKELFKSTDGGASWTRNLFPNSERLWRLRSGPGEAGVLFGTQFGGDSCIIWRSIDGAETWQRLGTIPAASDPRFMTPDPVNPELIFTSTLDGIEKSEDGGITWRAVTEYSLRAQYPFRLLIDPQAPDTFYLVNWIRQQLRLEPWR